MSLPELDPVIHQASRLRVLTVLFRNRELAVTTIRNELAMTDGNLASHLERLAQAGYVKVGRVLVGVSFEVHARITEAGSEAFRKYLAHLRAFLESTAPGDAALPAPPDEPASSPRSSGSARS